MKAAFICSLVSSLSAVYAQSTCYPEDWLYFGVHIIFAVQIVDKLCDDGNAIAGEIQPGETKYQCRTIQGSENLLQVSIRFDGPGIGVVPADMCKSYLRDRVIHCLTGGEIRAGAFQFR